MVSEQVQWPSLWEVNHVLLWEHHQHILKCLALDGHNFLLPSHNQSKFFTFEQWMKMVPFQLETRNKSFCKKLNRSVLNPFIYLMLYFSIIVLQPILKSQFIPANQSPIISLYCRLLLRMNECGACYKIQTQFHLILNAWTHPKICFQAIAQEWSHCKELVWGLINS